MCGPMTTTYNVFNRCFVQDSNDDPTKGRYIHMFVRIYILKTHGKFSFFKAQRSLVFAVAK